MLNRLTTSLAALRYRLLAPALAQAAAPVRQRPPAPDEDFRQLSFTFAVIGLSARVACSGAGLTQERYITFRESFPLKGGICGRIRSLFALACRDTTPTASYTQQLKALYPGKPELYEAVLERLFRIAAAGGGIGAEEEVMLADIAHQLELGAAGFGRLLARHHRPAKAAHILGVEENTPARTLKKRYHELMRRYHPDRFATEEISPELRLLLRLKASEINDAYKLLSQKH